MTHNQEISPWQTGKDEDDIYVRDTSLNSLNKNHRKSMILPISNSLVSPHHHTPIP